MVNKFIKKIFYKRGQNLISSHCGFTLVEALVAISLLMIAISSPMYIAQKGLSASIFSRDQMTASFLVQDGIEAVKNIRDYVAINQIDTGNPYSDWLGPLSDCICEDTEGSSCDFDSSQPSYCNIDTTGKKLIDNIIIKGINSNPLKINYSTDSKFVKFDLNSPSDSKFIRVINIKKSSDNPNEAMVKVRVSWGNSDQQMVEIKTFIYNYAPYL